MKRLKILDAANAELRDATIWYHERDPRVAARFTRETRRTLTLIETFPQLGAFVPGIDDRDVRRLPIHTFPYHVVFLSFEDRVEIVAVAHDRRRPTYFLQRLRRS